MSQVNKYKNMTASAAVKTGPGAVKGFYVNSTSSGTIKLWDDTDGNSGAITNTITPAVGWHELGNIGFVAGLYATIGGTLDVTVVYE